MRLDGKPYEGVTKLGHIITQTCLLVVPTTLTIAYSTWAKALSFYILNLLRVIHTLMAIWVCTD